MNSDDALVSQIVSRLLVAGILVGGLIGLLAILLSIKSVDAGTIGVVTRYGQVTGRLLSPGISMVFPFAEDVTTYNTKKVTYETSNKEKQKESQADYKDFPVDTNTEDGQPVDVAYTIRFSIDPTRATWLAQNIGNEEAVVEKIVKTESRVWARNVPRLYKADELYSGQGSQKVQNEIFDRIKGSFIDNGLILDFVGIREIVFDGQYVEAIKDKQVAAVQIETEKNKAEQAKFRKEQRITEAEAQAKEQDLQRLTITDQLLQKLWIEKWKGEVPQFVSGQGANLLFQMPSAK